MSGKQKKAGLLGRMFGGATTSAEPQNVDSDEGRADANPQSGALPSADEQQGSQKSAAQSRAPAPAPAGEDLGAGSGTTPPDPDRQITETVKPGSSEDNIAAAKSENWYSRLKSGMTKTSSKLSDGITGVFTKRKLDGDTIEQLEDLLIQADLGVETAMRITDVLTKGRYQKSISPDDVRAVLAAEVAKVLEPVAQQLVIDDANKPHVILFVGVNGTGKTTTIGKMAQAFADDGKKVMLAAGDTFRAAAIDQLKIWGERTGARVIASNVGADAAGLAFDAMNEAQSHGMDVLLIDTAGRLQNKQGLMDELEKVVRVIRKTQPEAPHDVLLVLDATTGQNALNQVEVFRQRAGVTGLVMTKLDGTARGGILVAIAAKFGLPVHAIGIGEGVNDLQPFDADEFAKAITLN